jgi:hypothetical protein
MMQETFGQNLGEPLPPLTDAQRAHAQQVCVAGVELNQNNVPVCLFGRE